MKKGIIIVISSLCFFISGCSLFEQMTCSHQYEEISHQEATCSTRGVITNKCILCEKIKKTYTEKLPHEYNQTVVNPTCTESGYTLNKCINCEYEEKVDIVSALGHELSNWETIKASSEISDGLRQRSCCNCDYIETEIIASTSYIDLNVIKEEIDEDKVYDFNTYEELLNKFNASVLSLNSTLTGNLKFDYDFNALLNQLLNDCKIGFGLSVSAQVLGDRLTINLNYKCVPNTKSTSVDYTQHSSLNNTKVGEGRDEHFDDFSINNSLYSYEVSTSEQLYYVLERGVKPICEEGSTAETIYNEMKNVLRQIISDEDDAVQIVKAIYDWLIMNVVYDNELLEELYKGNNNLHLYNGFYLEGVFLDKLAVCDGISKAFTALCNIEGIPCVSVTGYQTQNPSGAKHAWNKVYLNGKWYVCDATSGGTIISSQFEVLSYKYFLIDEETFSKSYTAENYQTLVCNSNINIYKNINYTYNSNTYDFYIESQAELNNIIAYFESHNISDVTIEFYIAFNYGTSAVDEVADAYKNNGIFKSYTYIDNGNIFMIIK